MEAIMSKFDDFIDSFRLREFSVNNQINLLAEKAIFNIVELTIDHLVCFDIGDVSYFVRLDMKQPEGIRLPFSKCLFMTQGYAEDIKQIIKYAILCLSGLDNNKFIIFRHIDNEWTLYSHLSTEDMITFYPLDGLSNQVIENSINAASVVLQFINIMSCKNIKREEITPPTKVQKKRLSNGKKPLISFWVLNVYDYKFEKGEVTSVSGSCKRLHLRRGHKRTYKNGLSIWVSSCLAGKGGGFVSKDYKFVSGDQ